MKVDLEPAYVLHRTDYSETSFLLEVLTARFGWRRLIARGARRGKRGASCILGLFQPLVVSWRGKTELLNMTDWEASSTPVKLGAARMYCALYINELTCRMARIHELEHDIFRAYEAAIQSLSSAANCEAVLRIYEKRLLQASGYGMLLTHLADRAETIKAGEHYRYAVSVGPVTEADAQYSVSVEGKTLLALAAEVLEDDEILRDAKQLMRYVFRTYLGSKPLVSKELFTRM